MLLKIAVAVFCIICGISGISTFFVLFDKQTLKSKRAILGFTFALFVLVMGIIISYKVF